MDIQNYRDLVRALGSSIPRTPQSRFADVINIKDDMVGNGVAQPTALAKWFTRLENTYSSATASTPGALARSGYIPGGLWTGDQEIFESAAYGYSLFGEGRVSQLQNITFRVVNSSARAGFFAIVGTGVTPVGTGLDLRSLQFLGFGIDIANKDICVDNSNAAAAGGAGSSNTLIGGWLRGGRIGVSSAQNDLRLAFLKGSDFTECGIDRWDGGGVHFIGNNFTTDTGPAIRWRGKSYNFTGDTVEGEFDITDVSDFTQIQVGDVIGSLAAGGTFPPNARISIIDEPGGTVTITLPANETEDDVTITVNQVPVEDFYVDNTFNAGRTDLLEFDVASIVSANAGASIRVTLSEQHQGVALGDDRIQFSGTNVYDSLTNIASQYVEAIEDWYTLVISMPYISNVGAVGKLRALNFDAEILSDSPTTNAMVRDQFFVGNNKNRTKRQGGANFSEIGIRNKTNDWFDGVRPFRGVTTNGSDEVTVADPTAFDANELRLGLPLTAVGVPSRSTVVEVIDAETFRISNDATVTSAVTGALFRSPYTPNNIFQIPVIDSGTLTETKVTQPSGPGSTVGWGQLALFPITGNAYMAGEGTYFVGGRAPYTAGGMANGQAAHLNEFGAMNTAILMRSNTVRNMLIGSVWQTTASELSLEQTNTAATGVAGTRAGADVSFNVRAYRSSNPGSVYGNAIQRWKAPRSTTDFAETAIGGAFAVLPGNSGANNAEFFIGAANTDVVLTGDAASLSALVGAHTIEISSSGTIIFRDDGAEYARFASTGTVGATMDVGLRSITAINEAFRAKRILNSAGNVSAFSTRDQLTSASAAYIAFDDFSLKSGTANFEFQKSFQSRPQFSFTGNVTSVDGFSSEPAFNFTGTMTSGAGFTSEIKSTAGAPIITNYRHVYVLDDDDYAGSCGTQYGLYIDALTKGTTNYAIWVTANRSRFGGNTEHAGRVFATVNASSPPAGSLAYITDSNTATWGATIAGGGANHVLAWRNNAGNWTVVGA